MKADQPLESQLRGLDAPPALEKRPLSSGTAAYPPRSMQSDASAIAETTTPSRFRQFGPTGLLALLWTVAPAVAGILLLGYVGDVSDWLLARPSTGLVIYVSVFIVAAGCGLLPTYAQAIVGGWVFGFAVGVPAALLGFTGAALLGYGIARSVSHDKIEQRINANRKARAVRDALVGHGPVRTFFIVALLRLPPNSPFALTNLAMASAGVPVVPYAAGTCIGMLPRTAAAIFFAAIASESARDIQEFVKEGPGLAVFIAGAVALFIVLGVIGVIANQALERINTGENRDGDKDRATDEAGRTV